MSVTEIIRIDVPRNLLLKANGGQGQVYANAQRAKHLRHRGATIGRDWVNRHQPWTPYNHVDIEYEIHYPKKPPRADPDNLAPTVKHLIDGLTDAGLWTDDDYRHLRRRTYTMGAATRKPGLWRVSIHITPIPGETS